MLTSSPRYDQEIVGIITDKLLPWWERHGMGHLVSSANTLKAFKTQPLPRTIRVSVKKRRGKKVSVRGPRFFENTSFKIATWPEDGQEAIRYPALACVLRGHADFHIADYVVHCPQQHFMLFNANVPQPDGRRPHFEGEDVANRSCEILWLLAPPGTANRISSWICYSEGEKHWIRQLFDYCLIERPEVLAFYNAFIREVTEQPEGYRKMAEVSLQAFLILFARELREGRFSDSQQGKGGLHGTLHSHSNPVELAIRHISHNLNQNLTTQSVADAVYMSRSTFIRRFQEETGQTFNRFLTERRLEEARHLLTRETMAIGAISRLVGLSPARLRSLFHEHHGASPSEFASTHRERNDTSDSQTI